MNHAEWWGSLDAQTLYWGGVSADDAGLTPKLTWTHQYATRAVLVPLATLKDDDPDPPRKFAEAWRRWRERGESPEERRRQSGTLRVPYDFAGSPDADRTIRHWYSIARHLRVR